MSNDYVFDIETYPNVFTLAVEHADAPLRWMFEISDWRNDSREIVAFLLLLKQTDARDGRSYFRDAGLLVQDNIEGHDVSPTTVDFNGDGVPDFLGGAEDGRFYYLRNPRTK